MTPYRVLCLAAIVVVCGFANSATSVSQPPAKDKIAALIEQLANDSYAKREEASRLLAEMDEALPALRAETRSPQLERRRRAEVLVARLRRTIAVRAHEQWLRRWCSEVEIDLFLDHLLAWPELADKRCRVFLTDWQRASVRWAEKHAGRKNKLPERDRWKVPFALENLVGKAADTARSVKRSQALNSKELGEDCLLGDGLVVFGGRAESDIYLQGASLISNLGIHWQRHLGKGKLLAQNLRWTYIFCDGDLELNVFPCSVIIATGDVKWKYDDKSKFGEDKSSIVIANARQHLKQLRLFDTKEVGVRVSDSAEGVRVDEVVPSSAMARAGLQRGDYVLTVGKDAVTSAEVFRKLIRRKVAEIDEATLEVRRAGKVLPLRAHF